MCLYVWIGIHLYLYMFVSLQTRDLYTTFILFWRNGMAIFCLKSNKDYINLENNIISIKHIYGNTYHRNYARKRYKEYLDFKCKSLPLLFVNNMK